MIKTFLRNQSMGDEDHSEIMPERTLLTEVSRRKEMIKIGVPDQDVAGDPRVNQPGQAEEWPPDVPDTAEADTRDAHLGGSQPCVQGDEGEHVHLHKAVPSDPANSSSSVDVHYQLVKTEGVVQAGAVNLYKFSAEQLQEKEVAERNILIPEVMMVRESRAKWPEDSVMNNSKEMDSVEASTNCSCQRTRRCCPGWSKVTRGS